MADSNLNGITSGVLTQELTTIVNTLNLGSWSRVGRTTGAASDQFQTFRTVGFVDSTFEAIFDANLTVGSFVGSTQRAGDFTVLQTDVVEIIAIRDLGGAGNTHEVDVNFFPGETGQGLPNLAAGHVNYNWSFLPGDTTAAGDVTSNRNFNFLSTITIPNLTNVSALGTDAEGRIVSGQTGSTVTEQATFPTNPTIGDIHIQTVDISTTGQSGFLPITNNLNPASIVLFDTYGCSGNICSLGGIGINLVSQGYVNIQINTDRNSAIPAIGVASNPLLLAWRPAGGTDADWIELTSTTNSAGNGNQRRIRAAITTSAQFSSLYDPIPVGAELGYRAMAASGPQTLSAGTFVFGGDDGFGNPDWNRISAINSAMAVPDSFVNQIDGQIVGDDLVITLGYNDSKTPILSDPITLPSGSAYYSTARFNEVGVLTPGTTARSIRREEITEGTTQFTLDRIADGLSWLEGDYGHAKSQDETAALNFRVVSYDGPGGFLVVIADKIVETDRNTKSAWIVNIAHLNLPLNIEGHVGGTDSMLISKGLRTIDFSNDDFILSSTNNGSTVVVASRGGAAVGTLEVQDAAGVSIDSETERLRIGVDLVATGRTQAGAITTVQDDIDHVQIDLAPEIPRIVRAPLGTPAITGTIHTYTITHNLSNTDVLVQVYDNTREMVIPMSIIASSSNQSTITFPVAVTGTVVIVG